MDPSERSWGDSWPERKCSARERTGGLSAGGSRQRWSTPTILGLAGAQPRRLELGNVELDDIGRRGKVGRRAGRPLSAEAGALRNHTASSPSPPLTRVTRLFRQARIEQSTKLVVDRAGGEPRDLLADDRCHQGAGGSLRQLALAQIPR